MKHRSSLLVILILAVLCGIAVFLYYSKSKTSSVDEDERKFSFRDTAAITKIFIADKDNNRSTLVRTKEGWVVNEKYNCRSDAILNLLEVIKLVEVKMPVPKSARDNVIKFMSYNAHKVEVYAGKKKVKQYYVGHETPDGEGSYMILSDPSSGENYKNPFICFIPGFVGYLQPRYIASENDWRDRIVINYIPPQISSIKVEHMGVRPDSSFVIELKDANTFGLKDLTGKNVGFEEEKLRQYLVYYQNISYEGLITGKNLTLQDPLRNIGPFSVITVKNKDGKEDEFSFYRKQFKGVVTNEKDVSFDFDPDRLYMSFDGGRQWAICQYYVFGKLLQNVNYFSPDPVKK